MIKGNCSKCKKPINDKTVMKSGRLEFMLFDLSRLYSEILCPECSKYIINIINDFCDNKEVEE